MIEAVKIEREDVFRGCTALNELTLGENVKKIVAGAFVDATSLETVYVYANRPPSTTDYIFSDAVYENATLYVPQGSSSLYMVTLGWSAFWTIKEFDSTGIENGITTDSPDIPIYNMKGVRMNGTRENLPAGIYIRDGKKVVIN